MKTYSFNRKAGFIVSILFVASIFSTCCQSRFAWQNLYIYTQAIFPGNIHSKDTGKPAKLRIDTATIVYIEMKHGVTPTWDVAWKNGILYNISFAVAKGNSVTVGWRKTDMQPVVIQAQKGNQFWLLRFNEPVQGTAGITAQKLSDINRIVLGTKNRNKQLLLPVGNTVELQPERRP